MGTLWTEVGAWKHLVPYGSVEDYQFTLNPLTKIADLEQEKILRGMFSKEQIFKLLFN